MRVSIWLCALLAVAPMFAQFRGLATTADGSELVFVSDLSQRGGELSNDPKLFRIQRKARAELVLTQTCDPQQMSGRCGILSPQITADGALAVYQSRIPCIGGSSCFLRELGTAALVRRDGSQTWYSGRIRISRNGRYLVNHDTSGAPGTFDKFQRLHDLQTGTVTPLIQRVSTAVAVSNDGEVLTSGGLLVRNNSVRTMRMPAGFEATGMDNDARFVVSARDNAFRVIEVGTGRVFEPCPADTLCDMATLSGDGQRLLFRMLVAGQRQLFRSRPDGSDWHQLTTWDTGVDAAAISDNGGVVWALLGTGVVLHVWVVGGSAVSDEVVAPTRQITAASVFYNSPGSVNVLEGKGMAAVEAVARGFDAPEELGGVRVRVGGVSARILSVSPTRIVYQLPWEAQPVEDVALTVEPESSQFVSPEVRTSIRAFAPRALAVVHEDFANVVVPERPARPGEVVHVFGTGLGPVTPLVETGRAAPLDRLVRTARALRFEWEGLGPADVLFSGLAPGMVGVYQVDVRVPDRARAGAYLLADGAAFANFAVELP